MAGREERMSDAEPYMTNVQEIPASLDAAREELEELDAKDTRSWFEHDREFWLRGYIAGRVTAEGDRLSPRSLPDQNSGNRSYHTSG